MIATAGTNPDDADIGIVMLHGRGSDSSDMKSVYTQLYIKNVYAIMPRAPFEIMPGRYAWYAHFWNVNLEENLKQIKESFILLDDCINQLNEKGFSDDQIVLIGHSQGANVLMEYCVNFPRKFKAIVSMRGCFLGNVGANREFKERLAGVSVVLNSGRQDPYIPQKKVDQTSAILEYLGANVIKKQYETGHGICRAEIMDLRKLFKNNFSAKV